MKNGKIITIIVCCILVLSLLASGYGAFSSQGAGQYQFKSLHGQTISIYGKGLYQSDSASEATQARSQDIVTLFVGVPLLGISLYLSRKGLLKGRLLLAGTLGYFLYTYTEYTFFAMYNPFYLIYVLLMSLSFYSFILTVISFDLKNFSSCFDSKLKVRFIGGFLIISSILIGLMWLKMIIPGLLNGTVPDVLEHYTTLVIQGLDLGIVLPASFISGILLIKKRPMGYLMSSVLIIKFITMLTAITAMLIGQSIAGDKLNIIETIIFLALNIMIIYPLYIILKSVKEYN